VGRFRPPSSQRADDERAIFSGRHFVIEDIVRPNAFASHEAGDEFTVLIRGGAVQPRAADTGSATPPQTNRTTRRSSTWTSNHTLPQPPSLRKMGSDRHRVLPSST
jgi:hypothetical protein